jgi:transcription elongation factor SPT6
MHEVLSMWSDKVETNGCLHINLHYLQREVDQTRLMAEFERIAVEVVNQVGVDLNACLRNPAFSKVIEFVCGLGPRKASFLIDRLAGSEVRRRKDLKNLDCIKDCVF